jgi:hypothetical protein
LVVNEGHEIHHVRERGYVQAPVRIPTILNELPRAAPFARLVASGYGERYIRSVPDGPYVDYLKRACAQVPRVSPYIRIFFQFATPSGLRKAFRSARAISVSIRLRR